MNVMFLCESLEPEKGLVFPNELDDYCGFPGMFIIEEKQGKLDEEYVFEAFSGDKKISLALQRYDGNTFYAKFGKDIFYFMAYSSKYFYAGKMNCLKNHNPFWILAPVNTKQLEDVCQKHEFFFVGSVD